jgi:hypothetical protein
VSALYTVRPLPDAAALAGKGRPTPFAAPWRRTLDDLRRELTALRATAVVLELDVPDDRIRIDGQLRAGARPSTPAVRLRAQTRHGALALATGEFGGPGDVGWHSNVRAIARTLEALRMVDRYGVQQGAQYAGYRAIGAGGAPAPAMTLDEAAVVLVSASGVADVDQLEVLGNADLRRALHRKAAARCHPDHGGDVARWLKLQTARELLDAPR